MAPRILPLVLFTALVSFARSAADEKYVDPALTPKNRAHWSFVPPKRTEPPKTQFPTSNPIDAFVRARLKKEGLKPAPEADRRSLIRRRTRTSPTCCGRR